jgi:hypothetical protein
VLLIPWTTQIDYIYEENFPADGSKILVFLFFLIK